MAIALSSCVVRSDVRPRVYIGLRTSYVCGRQIDRLTSASVAMTQSLVQASGSSKKQASVACLRRRPGGPGCHPDGRRCWLS